MQVTVDRDRCCGAGQCVLTAPAVFDQSEDDGLVQLLTDRPAPSEQADVRLAATLCPANVITVHESGD
ncbi:MULTISPECIES: ferredoxin [Kitasatospora]|uniref:Ferredoxin n=1 Tax=Kitasatospora cystarginea TaxID=58350 RepID=A0ABP5R552_9ACTN